MYHLRVRPHKAFWYGQNYTVWATLLVIVLASFPFMHPHKGYADSAGPNSPSSAANVSGTGTIAWGTPARHRLPLIPGLPPGRI
jgi:hypothetical protein